jgi:hypothetical protein
MSLFNWQKINYTSPASAQGGPGIQKAVTWYVGTPYIDMSLATLNASGLALGDTWWLGGSPSASGGNCFQVVKADEALTLGQLVAMADPATAANTIGPGSTTAVAVWDPGALTVNAERDNWIFIAATGATLPQLRRIKANTATTITVAQTDYLRPNSPTDADVFETAATDNDLACIIRPHHVKVCTATDVPLGVALGTVTQFNYTLIQKAGLAIVIVDADGGGATPIVVGKQAVSTAAGNAVGVAAPTIYSIGASMIPLFASTGAAGTFVPFYVNFTGA